MKHSADFIRRHLNTQEEICMDESLRLRSNLLLFIFIIFSVCAAAGIWLTADFGIAAAAASVSMSLISFGLFLYQFFRPAYSFAAATVFGLISLCLAGYFLWTGGAEGAGFVWLYTLPVVSAMVVKLKYTLFFDFLLTAMLGIFMFTPLHSHLPYQYSEHLRTVIPVSVLFVILCSFAAESARSRTQRQLSEVSEKLKNSAFTDPLTGTYNRRALLSHFGDLRSDGFGFSFAMLDLDHFKRINDNYGHDTGDKVLCHIVGLIRETIPEDADLYRWGGEEFLLVLRTSDSDELAETLDKLRRKTEIYPLVSEEGSFSDIYMTMSIGSICPSESLSVEKCINLADAGLCRAKEEGRNRVVEHMLQNA